MFSAIGFGILLVSAWLGGELVYRYRVSVNKAAATPSEPEEWTAVLDDGELAEGQPRRVEVEGEPVLLYRKDGQIHAVGAVCSHEGGPLEQGKFHAMFHSASGLLASQGISRSKHSGVISAFGEYFVKPGLVETDYAKMLGHAFNSRVGSDYDVTFSPERKLAEEIIQDAHRFVARAEAYLHQTGIL